MYRGSHVPGVRRGGRLTRSRTFSYKMHIRRGIGVERADANGMPPILALDIYVR